MTNKKTANVLIIDDHPIIIEGFEKVFNYIEEHSKTINFNIDSATDCKSAYHKIQNYAKTKSLDLVILDLSLPPNPDLKLNSGDDLGILIRKLLPNTKILVCTFYTNSFKIRQTIDAYNPIGFLNKGDVTFLSYINAVKDVLAGERHYSKTIVNAIMQKTLNNIALDKYDVLILKELANGSKMRDLIALIHLSKSSIDKRIRIMKRKFEIESNSDRDLVLAAREKGFI